MKKQSLGLAVLFLALVLSACAQQKNLTSEKSSDTKSKKTTKTKVSKTPPVITYMSMERTACFGKCPTYTVEVYNTGLVRYTSRMFTEYEGVYEKNVGSPHTQSLLSQFSENRVDTCSERYEDYIQDLPGIIYSFKYGKTTKKIYNANFGPDFLKNLSLKVDELAKIDGTWKKTAEQPKQ